MGNSSFFNTPVAYDVVSLDEDIPKPYVPPPPPPVASVTPRQASLALLAAGILDQAQTAVDAAGGTTKITWEYATEFLRNDPLIETIGASLGLTDEQIDVLFRYAATL